MHKITLLMLLGLSAFVESTCAAVVRDTFGLQMFHPTLPNTKTWNSAHWANGHSRTVTYAADPYDPTGWTDDHSGGTDGFRIDGAGTMTMSGSGPRFHINSLDTAKKTVQFFRNTEFTAYYQRKGSNGANYGGMIVGARSGPLGHASANGNICDATTYYGRFRNDGKWDFEKELMHPGSTYWSGSGFNTQDPLWHGAKLPQKRWIGMKYIVYDLDSSHARVRLELYIDSVTGADPTKGDHWERVGRVVDSGQWASGDVSGCTYPATKVISPGNGTFLLRTDGDTAVYKMVTIREIDPTIDLTSSTGNSTRSTNLRAARGWYLRRDGQNLTVFRNGRQLSPSQLSWTSLDGRELQGAPRSGPVLLRETTNKESTVVWFSTSH
jgi:hypothetical protein